MVWTNQQAKWGLIKLEFAYQKIKDVYDRKNISIQTKLRHYIRVVQPGSQYPSEYLVLKMKGEIENTEKKERKILWRLTGPNKTEVGYKLKSKTQIYQNTDKLSGAMRTRRLVLYVYHKNGWEQTDEENISAW